MYGAPVWRDLGGYDISEAEEFSFLLADAEADCSPLGLDGGQNGV